MTNYFSTISPDQADNTSTTILGFEKQVRNLIATGDTGCLARTTENVLSICLDVLTTLQAKWAADEPYPEEWAAGIVALREAIAKYPQP